MYRIDNATAATVLPTPASVGPNPNGFFQVGVPGITPSTVVDGDWANAVQEKIVAVLAAAGIIPSKTVRTQLVQAVKRLSGGNVTTIGSSGTTLTADNAGIVLVNASSGNISMTLPASASANGAPIAFHFARTDTSANTVSIALNAADTLLLGGGTGPIPLALNGVLSLFGDGISHWLQDRTPGGVQVFTGSGTFIVPAPVFEVEVWAGGSGSWASVSGVAGGGGSGGGYARKRIAGVAIGTAITVTVGAGGSAGVSGTTAPTAGGPSSFGSYCTATGGVVNPLGTVSVPSLGNLAGVGSGGDINLYGGDGGIGQANQGGLVFNNGGFGGEGPLSGGVVNNAGGVGTPGRAPGGGASGAGSGSSGTTPSAGAAGAAGLVVVRW
ncbi:MAG TPA: hypothetical protein VMB73_22000 [Acetobacteraceae bacterium]|nr:hypothetical protein [Acetobacteraceae bacterium]